MFRVILIVMSVLITAMPLLMAPSLAGVSLAITGLLAKVLRLSAPVSGFVVVVCCIFTFHLILMVLLLLFLLYIYIYIYMYI